MIMVKTPSTTLDKLEVKDYKLRRLQTEFLKFQLNEMTLGSKASPRRQYVFLSFIFVSTTQASLSKLP
ncbi:unnamed protein product [Trichobilharzia regenti]|nr:unnamed protein product [Trichobilharzia regenti]